MAFDIHVPLASAYSTLTPLSCPSVIQSNPDSFLYPKSPQDSSLTRSPSWPLEVPTGSVPVFDPCFSLLPEEHLSPQDLWTSCGGMLFPKMCLWFTPPPGPCSTTTSSFVSWSNASPALPVPLFALSCPCNTPCTRLLSHLMSVLPHSHGNSHREMRGALDCCLLAVHSPPKVGLPG